MNLFLRLFRKVFRKKIVRNLHAFCDEKKGHALMYFKTDPLVFSSLSADYSHTNNWEIIEHVKVFNRLGYWVDVIDRTATPEDIERFKLSDSYDIFFGFGAGDSGKYYSQIASRVPSALRIFYALGPRPDVNNDQAEQRHRYFMERHPEAKLAARRIVKNVDIEKVMQHTDVIFSLGGDFSLGTYKKFGKKIHRFYSAISPYIHPDADQFLNRDPKKFLYFGGNGNIMKGLDLVLDAFMEMPELELYICAPTWEEDFNAFYLPLIEKHPNIHFVGFVDVHGPVFKKLTAECGFVTILSCSEGMANSAITCMCRGLIPIVNYESGIDGIETFGFLLNDLSIEGLTREYRRIARISSEEFLEKSLASYFETYRHSQKKFSDDFEQSVILALRENGRLGIKKDE